MGGYDLGCQARLPSSYMDPAVIRCVAAECWHLGFGLLVVAVRLGETCERCRVYRVQGT